jgi:hypothetical protein
MLSDLIYRVRALSRRKAVMQKRMRNWCITFIGGWKVAWLAGLQHLLRGPEQVRQQCLVVIQRIAHR